MPLDSSANDSELTGLIHRLKKDRKAVILAHSYERPEVQDAADYVGDSLELSRTAAKTDADVIVFCSVRFMAETAKILSPGKTVLIPRPDAGCPLADTLTAEQLAAEKVRHPGAAVVAYVNCSAEVKALADVCCTSANAQQVVESVPEKDVLFVPDRHLGRWIQKHSSKNMFLWDGGCPTHHRLKVDDVLACKAEHPDALLLVHPECVEAVSDMADEVMSTSQMLRYCLQSPAKSFIIGTEMGLLHRLRKDMPDKEFIQPSKGLVCPNMKLTRLEDVAASLRDMKTEVEVPEPVRQRALRALDAMISVVPTR
jgi:quinolinate synthase